MKSEPYVLRFDGRIPAVRYYPNQEKGIKARSKYRKLGYHVQLFKIQTKEMPDAETRPVRRSYNKFLSRLTNRFRRRNR